MIGRPIPEFDIARLLKHCQRNETTGCLEFTGHKNNRGYGMFKVAGRPFLAHRCSYVHANGQIPEGTELDHKCRNTSCCNPEHLEAVSHSENQRRRVAALMKERTGDPLGYACKYGHTAFVIGNHRNRYCLVCSRARALAAYDNRKAALTGAPT